MTHRRPRSRSLAALGLAAGLASALAVPGCDEYGVNAQHLIIHEHAGRVSALVHEDMERARVGVRSCAAKLAPGFAVVDPVQRQTEIRTALGMLRDIGRPRMRVPELVATPISFVAAVGSDGHVIARDPGEDRTAPDTMAGMDLRALGPVRRVLDTGEEASGLVDFPGFTPLDPTVPIILFAVPAVHDGARLGVVVAGIPLWREAQKLSRQLQAEAESDGSIRWVYLYRGDALIHHGTPAELDDAMPNAAERAAGLATSPGGFTHGFMQHGVWFAWGVLPLPELGEDVGAVIARSDPP